MRHAAKASIAVLCGLLLLGASAPAAQWRTGDGLSVTLADATGRVEGLAVGGRALKLAAGGGGLSYREYSRNPAEPERVVLRLGAEGAEKTWSSAAFADWENNGDYVKRCTGGAPEGEAYLRLGDGKAVGAGMAVAKPVAVPAGSDCTISWWARTHQTDLTYILCLRLFDKQGRDITATAPPPAGWVYSPYSRAHYRSDLGNSKADAWERLSCGYLVPEEGASARLSLRVYRGGDLQADIDDLQVAVQSGRWSDEVPVRTRVEPAGERLRQRADLPAAGLTFETHYTSEAGQLRAVVEVVAGGPQPRGRCLQLRYRLPLALEGWTWSADPGHDEVIAPGGRYEAGVGLAGHRLSRYPLASVSRGAVGLGLAVPLDRPALQAFSADPDGLVTTVDLGLSPAAPRARGRFTFCLYRHDPAWTFRAALERYYALFPGLFAGATRRGGAWTLRVPRSEGATPEQFGLAYYECNSLKEEVRAYCRAHGLLTFFYSEPWGRRQVFPEAKSKADLPPYEQRLAALKQWAAEKGDGPSWNGAPRAEVAEAVLNSLLVGEDGAGAHLLDFYSSWAQWWQLNTDPDLPEPNIASVCRKYEIEPALQWADGIYLDSVSMTHSEFEDHAPGHLAAADLPLGFSLHTGTPVVVSGFADYEFMRSLRDDLHRRDKLLMLNLFAPATRLYGHLGDVVGCELGGLQNDSEALQQRIYAYRRPVSNLLQWRWAILERVAAMTPAEMEDYLANQLLYGFWPGVSTIGGGTEAGLPVHAPLPGGRRPAGPRPGAVCEVPTGLRCPQPRGLGAGDSRAVRGGGGGPGRAFRAGQGDDARGRQHLRPGATGRPGPGPGLVGAGSGPTGADGLPFGTDGGDVPGGGRGGDPQVPTGPGGAADGGVEGRGAVTRSDQPAGGEPPLPGEGSLAVGDSLRPGRCSLPRRGCR